MYRYLDDDRKKENAGEEVGCSRFPRLSWKAKKPRRGMMRLVCFPSSLVMEKVEKNDVEVDYEWSETWQRPKGTALL